MPFPSSFLQRPLNIKPSAGSMQSSHRFRTIFSTPTEPPDDPLPPLPTPSILNRLPHGMLGKVKLSRMWLALCAGVLAVAAGVTVVVESDVLAMSRTSKGVAWFEKQRNHLAVMAANKKFIVEKEDGKWRARVEQEERN